MALGPGGGVLLYDRYFSDGRNVYKGKMKLYHCLLVHCAGFFLGA